MRTFKILFLDEADALTTDAQAALRRTMESYAKTCRFILSCNYSSKIIDPIQSRCAIYRFKPLAAQAVKEEIRRIAAKEGLTITPGAMDAIVYIAQGDMRKAINALQGAAIISTTIEEKMVYAITSNARPDEIEELLHLALAGDFDGAESLLAHLLHERGIAPNELINQCYRALVKREMDRALKVELIDHLGETDFRLSEGASSDIQMEALIARFVLASTEEAVRRNDGEGTRTARGRQDRGLEPVPQKPVQERARRDLAPVPAQALALYRLPGDRAVREGRYHPCR